MYCRWHLGFCNWTYTPTYRGFDSFMGYYNGAEDYYTHVRGNTRHHAILVVLRTLLYIVLLQHETYKSIHFIEFVEMFITTSPYKLRYCALCPKHSLASCDLISILFCNTDTHYMLKKDHTYVAVLVLPFCYKSKSANFHILNQFASEKTDMYNAYISQRMEQIMDMTSGSTHPCTTRRKESTRR